MNGSVVHLEGNDCEDSAWHFEEHRLQEVSAHVVLNEEDTKKNLKNRSKLYLIEVQHLRIIDLIFGCHGGARHYVRV